MYTILTILHILACVFLVMVVLLQTGKGADMGAVFGGSSSTVFGSTGAGNFLTRLTTITTVIFMLTSISLTYLSSRARTATSNSSRPSRRSLGASSVLRPFSRPSARSPSVPSWR